MPTPNPHARRGTLLVVVLGLITIFLALMLAITVRVYNSTKGGTVLQQNVQAYLMLIAAKKVIAGGGAAGNVTGGDELSLYANCHRPFADSLGWFHIKAAGTRVLAVGGSSHKDTVKTAITDGDPQRNAYEIRLYYSVDTATTPLLPTALLPADNNANYW